MSVCTTTPSRFVGCDVSKTSIVVFDTASSQTRVIPNRASDLARFAHSLDQSCLVICEATGGYETRLLDAMLAAGRAAHRADARKVKAFIRSFGTLGKSDAIDAQALARYGAERHASLAPWQAQDPARRTLQALVLLRIDLVAMRQAQLNRLAAPQAGDIAPLLRPILRHIETQIRAIEARIAALIRVHPTLRQALAILRTIPGIGDVSAAALLALMPELGRLSGRQAAALAGVAPHPYQSGSREGYRSTRGGRTDLKRALFMPALVASRAKGSLSIAYQRIIARGKKPIVAITALMRKIIVIANAKLRDAFLSHPLSVS